MGGLILFLLGCGNTDYIVENDTYRFSIVDDKFYINDITLGMSVDDVTAFWGEPIKETITIKYEEGETYDVMFFSNGPIYFLNDEVANITIGEQVWRDKINELEPYFILKNEYTGTKYYYSSKTEQTLAITEDSEAHAFFLLTKVDFFDRVFDCDYRIQIYADDPEYYRQINREDLICEFD